MKGCRPLMDQEAGDITGPFRGPYAARDLGVGKSTLRYHLKVLSSQ